MTITAKGGLFKNQHKNSDNHPDYRGDFTITPELLAALGDSLRRGHAKVQVAGWKKESRDGRPPFLSITVSPPYEKPGEQQQSRPTQRKAELDDDIPF